MQVLSDSCDIQISQLPAPAIKGDALSIKITQSEYERGVSDCKKNLHGRLVLNKGDKPMTARDLSSKLTLLWKTTGQWRMISLGRGFYEFQFASFEDMRIAWSMGTINLKPGVLRLSKWTNDFNPFTQRQTHAQIWIRLMELPQEYWRQRTLFEIASAIGTPLSLDDSTRNRTFGHYARILVDIDLSRRIFDEIRVERDGYDFPLAVVYERLPEFCSHCQIIGHTITMCKWLHPVKDDERSKKIIKIKQEAASKQYMPKKNPHHNDSIPRDKLVPDVAIPMAKAIPALEQSKSTHVEEVPPQHKQIVEIDDSQELSQPVINIEQQRNDSSFSFALDNVTDEIVNHDLHTEAPVIQRILTNDTVAKDDEAVPETQVTIANDDEFNAEVQKDLQVAKQLWADMADENPFKPVVSKSQRKRIKQLARSAGQPYNTRAQGAPSNSI
jgi:hypothetical protein